MGAAELLEEAIEAHGGAPLYDSTSELTARLRCAGWAFPMRFKRGAFSNFTGTVSTREPHAVLAPHPRPGQRGIFERDRVRIETDAGEVVAERTHPRAAFGDFRRKVWWDDLDLVYFGGYALWGYLNAPFMLRWPGFEIEETEPWRENGETWRGLRVLFPPDIPAHSREQRYYFDERGLIRRNDYTAEVFGSFAKATHYSWDHERFDGFVVPTRRKAMPRRRNGKPVQAVTVVAITFDDVAAS